MERLAHNLNLHDPEIHRIRNDDPVLFGIRVLKAWKNDHSHNTPSDARQELATKLKQSGLHRQAKRVQHLSLRGMYHLKIIPYKYGHMYMYKALFLV